MSALASPKHRWLYAPLAFGLFASSCSHGSLIVALLFGARGNAGGGGENGQSGAGGTTIDVSLAGAEAEQAATTEVPATPPPAAPDDTTEPEPAVAEQVTAPANHAAESSASHPAHAAESANGTADVTSSGKLPGPTHIGFPNVGIDGDSVNGQRALLPAAVSCSDAVAGRWEALKYNPLHGMWVHFTLSVHRSSAGELSGTILSRTWAGSPFDRFPPPCTLGGLDETVSMSAFGRADSAGRIAFGATRYAVVSVQCPPLDDPGYAPDHFSGAIDSAREEFQSLNNDGATDVNAPYVFRRTGCL